MCYIHILSENEANRSSNTDCGASIQDLRVAGSTTTSQLRPSVIRVNSAAPFFSMLCNILSVLGQSSDVSTNDLRSVIYKELVFHVLQTEDVRLKIESRSFCSRSTLKNQENSPSPCHRQSTLNEVILLEYLKKYIKCEEKRSRIVIVRLHARKLAESRFIDDSKFNESQRKNCRQFRTDLNTRSGL